MPFAVTINAFFDFSSDTISPFGLGSQPNEKKIKKQSKQSL